MVTVSKTIKLITIVNIEKRSKTELAEAFDHTFRIYYKSGFIIKKLHVDPEFEPLK